uniref:Uncharacterized protein n=1 Tax=Amphimedon queenslandica TaxID=400682 RepID=A0A1X7VHG8_AMPQE
NHGHNSANIHFNADTYTVQNKTIVIEYLLWTVKTGLNVSISITFPPVRDKIFFSLVLWTFKEKIP